jgi:adenosylcobinamide amidohydrolase/ABC-type Fe3+-hydroxamate transport system substrate-binding protein
MRIQAFFSRVLLVALLVVGPCVFAGQATGYPLTIKDSLGREVSLVSPPRRVVCLLNSVTDLLVTLGRTEMLVGLNRQDLLNHSALRIPSVGSFFQPDLEAITAARPDLIIASTSHHDVLQQWPDNPHPPATILYFREGSLEDGFARMALIGRLVEREQQAQEIIKRNREQIELVRTRLQQLPRERRIRVARVVVGGERLHCPGDDSFQNEMITAAGGIPPRWDKSGGFVPVDVDTWQGFNPQMVYGCDRNMEAVQRMLAEDGWKDVEAVRKKSFTQLPCSIACQVTPHVGAAVQWLAASFYPELMADASKAVSSNTVQGERPLTIDLPYVHSAQVVNHRINDADFKSLVLRFTSPQRVLSTADDNPQAVQAVGNTYVPMHASLGHMAFGVDQVRKEVAANLGYTPATYSGMMTGADMDNLSVQVRREGDLEAVALVTAGTRGNAQRMSKDIGYAHASGTINILLLTNRKLAPEAMARAMITATEAKTAALLDLDIRSTALPWPYQATGTGTDSMIVVQGEGPLVHYTGGHGKIGELIAKAVHAGVTEALVGQNGIKAGRSVLQRLDERKMSLERLVRLYPSPIAPKELERRLEQALESPAIAGFIETALAISDAAGSGLVSDLASFERMAETMGERLAGTTTLVPATINTPDILPPVMARAFGLLVAGVSAGPATSKEPQP